MFLSCIKRAILGLALLLAPCGAENEQSPIEESVSLSFPAPLHTIRFASVPIHEFIRYVGKISEKNFVFDNQELQFNISFSTGKPVPATEVLKALLQILRSRGFTIAEEDHFTVIHGTGAPSGFNGGIAIDEPPFPAELAANDVLPGHLSTFSGSRQQAKFSVYKLQYHQGGEIEEAIKQIASDLRGQPSPPLKLLNAIQTMHWVKATNSLLFSGDNQTVDKLRRLIASLDVPLKQVFIEVLVIETSVKNMLDFGLQWGAGGKYKDRFSFGTGNFAPGTSGASGQPGPGSQFARELQGTNATNKPSGFGQIPIVGGFDIGVIGDIIMHKGTSYLSLGSLVSALQMDGDSTIVLNQKIITQDNKKSTIFVGENIPFTGSVVQTVGQSQQTTANVEYRDVGVSLTITPTLGEGEVITLDLVEEITEARNNPSTSQQEVSGIRTSKTNMATHVHVPDQHFLVLSGTIRNTTERRRSGIPLLGWLPIIGAAFSKTEKVDDRRNVIIFVRPHIIKRMDDHEQITADQEALYKKQSQPADFQRGLSLVPSSEEKPAP